MEVQEIEEFSKEFAQMNRTKQRTYFASNKGIFTSNHKKPSRIIGPILDSSGQIIGDMLIAEQNLFFMSASAEQKIFYEKLVKINEILATEYMFRISGAIYVWKEDIQWLRVLEHYLHSVEKELERDEEILEVESHFTEKIKLPHVVRTHFPEIFSDIDILTITGDTIKQTVQKIRETIKKYNHEENYIKSYIANLRKRMPFLFEK